jgi:hypothetical protein
MPKTEQQTPAEGSTATPPGTGAEEPQTAPPGGAEGDTARPQGEPETFTREYVQQLRDEAATHRVKAKDRDALAQRLHTVLVAASGRLADPTDLPFDEEHLTDEAKLTAAIDELLTRKPHLESRTPRGEIGQGARGTTVEPVDLAAMLRGGA